MLNVMSAVWKFFKKNGNKEPVSCNLCGKTYKTCGNTTNLATHLKTKHHYAYLQMFQIHSAISISILNNNKLSINKNPENDVADLVVAQGYIPKNKDLPKPSIEKNSDTDVTYLLSKLSDENLIKLLSDQPNKSEYNVKDLVQISANTKYNQKYNPSLDIEQNSKTKTFSNMNNIFENFKKKRFETVTRNNKAVFRLEHKDVEPFATSKNTAIDYAAGQKLNNLLYSHPAEAKSETLSDIDDEKKELLFDVLVGQLKALCCTKNKAIKDSDRSMMKFTALLNQLIPQETTIKSDIKDTIKEPNEHMFLILNDEIKSHGNEEHDLILVDPDSLGKNSSVMLLGPIATHLSDSQLKLVMMRISNELAKSEYLPLLQQISDGTLYNKHIGLLDNLVHGPQTRRYIKPHRCNHQSVLSRVYGGPKWLICTGYLNLNKPSLYD